MAFALAMPYHSGEERLHTLMRVPPGHDNPTSPFLTPQASNMLSIAPLLALGTLDPEGYPWTTIWGGSKGHARAIGNGMVGIRTPIEKQYDPVINLLFGDKSEDDAERDIAKGGQGKIISALTIDLDTRKRVKICGRMVAGGIVEMTPDEDGESQPAAHSEPQHEVQLVLRVDQSLGNCPKYLNKKTITSFHPSPKVVSDSAALPQDAIDLIHNSDLFFVSSAHEHEDMDTNHRGGPAGFVRATNSTVDGKQVTTITWPEYSGNRLYQTLGNLYTSPKAGLVFPDFATGNVLYLTGTSKILVGDDASSVLPRSNLAVQVAVTSARFVENGLPFRGTSGEKSPYNPRVRLLKTEEKSGEAWNESTRSAPNSALLMENEKLTDSINRYTFKLSESAEWKAGAWVALDLSEELNLGYSHMRDDDPGSLNDDFVRTFTVSSGSRANEKGSEVGTAARLSKDHFQITVRDVGTVTDFLARKPGGGRLEIGIRGFGGGLDVELPEGQTTGFVAGGVGITPLLAQMSLLSAFSDRLKVFWTASVADLGLIVDTLERFPVLKGRIAIYLTKGNRPCEDLDVGATRLEAMGIDYYKRRLAADDLTGIVVAKWYACVSTGFRKMLLGWLSGQEVLYEDFNY